MNSKPIPFTDELILAIQKGQKWVTRRPFVMKRAKIRVLGPVGADAPFGIRLADVEELVPMKNYKIDMNSYGAVSALTRGKVKGKWEPFWLGVKPGEFEWVSPWGAAGDEMWVREAWKVTDHGNSHFFELFYRADGKIKIIYEDHPGYDTAARIYQPEYKSRWRPPMFMFRWASRITLPLVGVRVERLQDITEDDAEAEGVMAIGNPMIGKSMSYRDGFERKWVEIYGQKSWDANDWVYRLEFKPLQG